MEKEQLAQRLQHMLAALPVAVVILNPADCVVDCNRLAFDFLGGGLLGRAWPEVVAEHANSTHTHSPDWQLPSGTRLSLSYQPLAEAAGQIIVLSDVTQMHTLQNALNQQKQLSAMGEMVASLAHQVRTPLSTAILYASQLHRPSLPVQKRQEFTDKIIERLKQLDRHVNDMLIFAKEGRVTMDTIELPSLLLSLQEHMHNVTRNRSVHFVLTDLTKGLNLPGNADALQGALLNLLSNAVDAVQDAGVVSLTLWQHDQQLCLLIKDSGAGISEADAAHIFEPFFTTKLQGTGLGLAVAAQVLTAHGGSITCWSKPGAGAAFVVRLPCWGVAPTAQPVSGLIKGNRVTQEQAYAGV
jgi:two-component system sensor histidine kinase FlrB